MKPFAVGWICGGVLAAVIFWLLLSPTLQLPVDEITVLLALLGAVIGGAIARRGKP